MAFPKQPGMKPRFDYSSLTTYFPGRSKGTRMALLLVKAAFDREAAVWYVSDTDVPGLATEAASFDALCEKVLAIAPELLELNGWQDGREVVIEIIAHATSKVRLAAA